MQTIAIQVQDDCVDDFMNYINNYSANITIKKDKNLENDSFFYERKKELDKIRNDIQNGQSQLISFDDFEDRTNKFEKELELKYAH
jgi:hypothetical protein